MSNSFRTTIFDSLKRTCSVCGKEFYVRSPKDYLYKFGTAYQCGYNCHQIADKAREANRKHKTVVRGY